MNLAQLQHEETSLLSRSVPGFAGETIQPVVVVAQGPVADMMAQPALPAQRRRPTLGRAARAVAHQPLLWVARMKQRRALMRLDDRLLADVGLSRGDAVVEYNKPFWRS
jgi:uncharacterized protein YjiS (DUF1127 family)